MILKKSSTKIAAVLVAFGLAFMGLVTSTATANAAPKTEVGKILEADAKANAAQIKAGVITVLYIVDAAGKQVAVDAKAALNDPEGALKAALAKSKTDVKTTIAVGKALTNQVVTDTEAAIKNPKAAAKKIASDVKQTGDAVKAKTKTELGKAKAKTKTELGKAKAKADQVGDAVKTDVKNGLKKVGDAVKKVTG